MMLCAMCKEQIEGKNYKTKNRKRYHYACYETLVEKAETKHQQHASGLSNKDNEALEAYICTLYDLKEIPETMKKQIEGFVSRLGYTYAGIQEALHYFYALSGKAVLEEHKGTIGIVPYCYDEAQKFLAIKQKAAEVNESFIPEEKNITVKIKPKDRRMPLAFTIEEELHGESLKS